MGARLRPAFAFEGAEVLRLDDEALLADPALRAADPTLESVVNVNEHAVRDAVTDTGPTYRQACSCHPGLERIRGHALSRVPGNP